MEPKPANKVRVFIASPGDVAFERSELAKVIEELNTTIGPHKNIVLELVRWETHCNPSMGRPQGVINTQIGKYNIFVGVMWKRFGSPTGIADSGTEEEFRNAYAEWEKDQTLPILFYFSQKQYQLRTPEEVQQCGKVLAFRNELEEKGLVWEYLDERDFSNVVRPHISRLILDMKLPDQEQKTEPTEDKKPELSGKLFIGSSIEGREVAEKLAAELEHAGVPAIAWSKGVFELGEPIVASLDRLLSEASGAIMIFTADDVSVSSREPNSNLIYEVGLFHGSSGRNRTFILAEENTVLPSDLSGVQYFRFNRENLHSVVAQIRRVLSVEK